MATAWVAMLVLSPWLAAVSDVLAGASYLVGSLVCHQQPGRSFHLDGAQLPVCARCLGLYAGAAVGLIGWAAVSRRRERPWPRAVATRHLLISAVPTGVTVATAWLGIGDPANWWRALLALPLGIVGGLLAGAMTTNHLK